MTPLLFFFPSPLCIAQFLVSKLPKVDDTHHTLRIQFCMEKDDDSFANLAQWYFVSTLTV